MNKEKTKEEKKTQEKPRRVSFSFTTEEYDMFEMESIVAGYRKPGLYAKHLVINREMVQVVDSGCISDNTLRVGKAVDLADAKLREAERDPEAWKYEADMDIIRDLLDEVRGLQTELVKSVINYLR